VVCSWSVVASRWWVLEGHLRERLDKVAPIVMRAVDEPTHRKAFEQIRRAGHHCGPFGGVGGRGGPCQGTTHADDRQADLASVEDAVSISVLTASHYGVVRFGDLECEAVVLLGGERGYVRRALAKMFGFNAVYQGSRFAQFLAEIAPNTLEALGKTGLPILLSSGRKGQFFPAGFIPEVSTGVVTEAHD
jgi:hypothetical protein